VYGRQQENAQTDAILEDAYNRGLSRLTEMFVERVVKNVRDRVRERQWCPALRSLKTLARERPLRLLDLAP
jgi:hypothetical protein